MSEAGDSSGTGRTQARQTTTGAGSGCDCLVGSTLDLVEAIADRLRRLDEDDPRPEPQAGGGRDALLNRLIEEVRQHKAEDTCVCGRRNKRTRGARHTDG